VAVIVVVIELESLKRLLGVPMVCIYTYVRKAELFHLLIERITESSIPVLAAVVATPILKLCPVKLCPAKLSSGKPSA